MVDKLSREEVIRRLRELEGKKVGERLPDWLATTNWGPGLSKLAGQAADLIEGKDDR